MFNNYNYSPYPYYLNTPSYMPYRYNYPCRRCQYGHNYPHRWIPPVKLRDHGPNPYVVNIEEATMQNDNFRTTLWTGSHLQLTLMSIDVRDEIGLEMHPDVDQFIRIEQGEGIVMMGDCKDNLDYMRRVCEDYAIFIPAGRWHNLINTGYVPIKLYSIYAPPEHPHGTVHRSRKDAEEHHEK